MMTTEQLWEDFHVPLRQFIRAQEKVGSWLYQIARHVITDHFRSQQNKATTILSDDLAEQLVAPEEAEENEAVQSLLPRILPLVQRLPLPYRQALLLTEVEGMTQKDLAERLDLSFSGAKWRALLCGLPSRSRLRLHAPSSTRQ